MGCFSCNGKMAKSSCRGRPWMCVYPDGGWMSLPGPIPCSVPSNLQVGGGCLPGPWKLQADAPSGLLVSVLTPAFWVHTLLPQAYSRVLSWLCSGTCPLGHSAQ